MSVASAADIKDVIDIDQAIDWLSRVTGGAGFPIITHQAARHSRGECADSNFPGGVDGLGVIGFADVRRTRSS